MKLQPAIGLRVLKVQCQLLLGKYQFLELDFLHAQETPFYPEQVNREPLRPHQLYHTRKNGGFGEVTLEIGVVTVNLQRQTAAIVDILAIKHRGQCVAIE